jgi:5-methylcytosine-specific restriction endonuclease McrA
MQIDLFPEYSLDTVLQERLKEAAADVLRQRDETPHATIKDLTGKRFGKLVVLHMTNVRQGYTVVWAVKCDCGTPFILATARHLQRINDCGCGRGKPGTNGYKGNAYAQPSEDVARRNLYATYRSNATRRGKEFNLSRDEFDALTTSLCHYCGTEPSQVNKAYKIHECLYSGIDRVDSSKGYITGNCVPCCGQCNKAKGEYSEADFLDWLRRAYWHNFKDVNHD